MISARELLAASSANVSKTPKKRNFQKKLRYQRYYAKNKEKRKADAAKWNREHPKRRAEIHEKWLQNLTAEKAEARKAANRKWYKKHRKQKLDAESARYYEKKHIKIHNLPTNYKEQYSWLTNE